MTIKIVSHILTTLDFQGSPLVCFRMLQIPQFTSQQTLKLTMLILYYNNLGGADELNPVPCGTLLKLPSRTGSPSVHICTWKLAGQVTQSLLGYYGDVPLRELMDSREIGASA